jgi:DNA excision repair protein ERCC-2
MDKRISLSVVEFALPAPRKGSIDLYSGFGSGGQALGLEIHQRIQNIQSKADGNYHSEVKTNQHFSLQGYRFEICGRMDGVFYHEKCRIEEIKSAFNIEELYQQMLKSPEDHPYCLQLKTYGYFHWLQHKEIPELYFHLVSTRNSKTKNVEIELNLENYEHWLQRRLQELVAEATYTDALIKRRKYTAKDFSFPFEKQRPGQVELIAAINTGIKEKQPMLIQAPTGMGKTVGVLYPVLHEALKRGQKTIYLTPKNSQYPVVEDAVERLKNAGAKIKSLTLTAKTKMCFKNEPICNPDYCEYAKDHYTKIADNKLTEKLAKSRQLNAITIRKLAKKYEVCPYQLQFEAANKVDVIVCDYNYVFSPHAQSTDSFKGGIGEKGKPNLIIDEIHNLPARGMDYYSPALSSAVIETIRSQNKNIPAKFLKKFSKLAEESMALIASCGNASRQTKSQIVPPLKELMAHDVLLRSFLTSYLESDVEIEREDPILKLSRYWSEFTEALLQSDIPGFFVSYNPYPPTIKITCCDASNMLKESYKKYAQIIGFSATLKPFDFYSELSGLKHFKVKTVEFSSPFPKSRRKILIIPQISSKYLDRQRSYPRVAETIQRIIELKKGNYFIFFPSFEFLERVYHLFNPSESFQVLKQERGMSKEQIQLLLDKLKDENNALIIFAVQGGVFSEGVDYPGKMLIGAFIVGPPLPNFDFERELMKTYYHSVYANGFDYAYTYPAMAKSVQAAGRVIRSDTDAGFIILLDNRFVKSEYAQCMPRDWFEESPMELISNKILNDLSQFWSSVEEVTTPEEVFS